MASASSSSVQRLATFRRRRARRGDQQRRLLAGQLARGARARLLAQRELEIALHEAPLRPIHRRATDRDAARDLLVSNARVGGQQDLRPLKLTRRVPATAEHRHQSHAFCLGQFDPVAYVHRRSPLSRATMNRQESVPRALFTPRQGQYLAFIHAYTLVNGRPPAHADIQRFFRLTPPTVHQMLLTLEKARLISRLPGQPRSLVVLVKHDELPRLDPPDFNQSKSL
jgi:hypothetical protein